MNKRTIWETTIEKREEAAKIEQMRWRNEGIIFYHYQILDISASRVDIEMQENGHIFQESIEAHHVIRS